MSDEAAVVVGILGLITAMIVVLVRQQRRREARLAALAEIEIPIQSVGRAALIIAALSVVGGRPGAGGRGRRAHRSGATARGGRGVAGDGHSAWSG